MQQVMEVASVSAKRCGAMVAKRCTDSGPPSVADSDFEEADKFEQLSNSQFIFIQNLPIQVEEVMNAPSLL